MARPRQWSDDEILAAARACFLEHGPQVSTAVIADEVGMSQGALFKRFGTKHDLLVAALAPPAVIPWVEALADGPDPDRPVREQLLELAREVAAFFERLVPGITVLSAAPTDHREVLDSYEVPPPLQAQRAVSGWLRGAIEQGRLRSVDPDATALVLLGGLQVRAFLRHVLGQPVGADDAAYHAEQVVDALWHGLAPAPEGAP